MIGRKEYPKTYLYKRVVQAKMFIDKNYSKPLDLNLVSNEAAFSKFHFIRLFKKIYGMTPHIYLRKVRIDHAKEFLETGLSVIDACDRVGFESIGSFTTLFKKESGDTPAHYRQKKFVYKSELVARPIRFVPNCFAVANGWPKKAILEK